MTDSIGAMVRRRRDDLGISAQGLADACTELGHPIARNSISNLENGRRSELSVAELVVMAEVLRLPPVELLFGAHLVTGEVEYLPGKRVMAWDALRHFTGETPHGIRPSTGDREYSLSLMRQLDDGAARYASVLRNVSDLRETTAALHARLAVPDLEASTRAGLEAELSRATNIVDQFHSTLEAVKDGEALIKATLSNMGFRIDHSDNGEQP